MNRPGISFLIAGFLVWIVAFNCAAQTANPGVKGLKDYYKDYFSIGVALSQKDLVTDAAPMIVHEFNSLTPDNAMKFSALEPKENVFTWYKADSIVDFAMRNHMKIRGHTLCWHDKRQLPAWLGIDSAGNPVSKEVLLQRLKNHIYTIVKRYKGKVYAWDVVNEVISDNPKEYIRTNTLWYKICGPDYIAKAYQYAHEADPGAILFYNDYNYEDPIKRKKIFRLVKNLRDAGIPVQGVGMQSHWAVNTPTQAQLDTTLKLFAGLGVNIQITEMDVSAYPKENVKGKTAADFNTSYTPDKEEQQVAAYKMYFEMFRKYRQYITGVTFWNVSDRRSWLDEYPVKGRKDYPLLFDKNMKPKKAYTAVVDFK